MTVLIGRFSCSFSQQHNRTIGSTFGVAYMALFHWEWAQRVQCSVAVATCGPSSIPWLLDTPNGFWGLCDLVECALSYIGQRMDGQPRP